MINFFFDGWQPVIRILVIGSLAYVALVLLLRVSGKRSLAQMNPFDFIVTVAIGASFGRLLTARTVPLVEAVTAFGLLLALQYGVTMLQMRSRRFAALVTGQPTLIAYRGQLLDGAMRAERFTESEVLGAVRKKGYGSLAETYAVVVENDGKLAVIGPGQAGDGGALPERGREGS